MFVVPEGLDTLWH